MQNFQAKNGYWVSFISHGMGTSDYRLERGGESVRLVIPDKELSTPRIQCGELTTEHLDAYNEYVIEENRRYQQWRKDNARLLTA